MKARKGWGQQSLTLDINADWGHLLGPAPEPTERERELLAVAREAQASARDALALAKSAFHDGVRAAVAATPALMDASAKAGAQHAQRAQAKHAAEKKHAPANALKLEVQEWYRANKLRYPRAKDKAAYEAYLKFKTSSEQNTRNWLKGL